MKPSARARRYSSSNKDRNVSGQAHLTGNFACPVLWIRGLNPYFVPGLCPAPPFHRSTLRRKQKSDQRPLYCKVEAGCTLHAVVPRSGNPSLVVLTGDEYCCVGQVSIGARASVCLRCGREFDFGDPSDEGVVHKANLSLPFLKGLVWDGTH